MRYQRGAHNVFEKKDNLGFRRNAKGNYEIFNLITEQIKYTEPDIIKAINKWEELAK